MPEHVPFVISHIVDQDIHIIDKLEQGDDFVKPAAVGAPAEAGIDRERNEKQIVNLHCNLRKAYTVSFNGKTQDLKQSYLGWAFGKDIYL